VLYHTLGWWWADRAAALIVAAIAAAGAWRTAPHLQPGWLDRPGRLAGRSDSRD